ncbi:MAG TPA: O-antigen ligase family protein [Solirubrobacterales bacterium]|nr:O-antigen ligase family protein [Solirubrobacterales bacterium]
MIAVWLLGFGAVFYLSMQGGGYDLLVRNQVGIAIWWVAVVGVVVGALPVRRPNRLVLVALGLLLGFAIWTGLSLFWTESQERTANELSRMVVYVGIFALALLIRGTRGTRQMVAAVGAAIALVGLIALASRLQPDLIGETGPPVRFLVGAETRLSYPINYWNGLAALIAVGIPLLLYMAVYAKPMITRIAASGALPALILALYFTYSRTGTGAAVVGVLVFVIFANDRIKLIPTLLLTSLGGAALIQVATSKDALQSGLAGPLSRSEGDDMTILTIVVCLTVAVACGGINWILTERRRPGWLRPSRRMSQIFVAGGLVAILLVAIVAGGPSRISNGIEEFKSTSTPSNQSNRLSSSSGNGRYQYWKSALDQMSTAPVGGTGSGTFEFWWSRNGDLPGFIRDTHSLYFQTLGELGVVGLLLLLGFVGVVLLGGAYRTVTTPSESRGQAAAALAGCGAFCLAAGFDWTWQIAAIPAAFLLLAAVLLAAEDAEPAGQLRWYGRAGFALVGVVALVAIAIPLASTTKVRDSQSQAEAGDLSAALDSARAAIDIQPSAATPYLQEALILEVQGDLDKAVVAARRATENESTNWRNWIVLSRIEAERGRATASTDAYREARKLNPRASIFQ